MGRRRTWPLARGSTAPAEVVQLKDLKTQSLRNPTAQLKRAALVRADDEARRIPWQRLQETRNQYIDWQEFQLWVRSILEVEGHIPDWLIEIVTDRCPGFLECDIASTPEAAKTRPLALRLEDSIDETYLALLSRKARSLQLRTTPYETRATSELKCAGRSAPRSGREPNRSSIRRSRSGKAWRRNVTRLPILCPVSGKQDHR